MSILYCSRSCADGPACRASVTFALRIQLRHDKNIHSKVNRGTNCAVHFDSMSTRDSAANNSEVATDTGFSDGRSATGTHSYAVNSR